VKASCLQGQSWYAWGPWPVHARLCLVAWERLSAARTMDVRWLLVLVSALMLAACDQPAAANGAIPPTAPTSASKAAASGSAFVQLEYESDGVTPKRYSVTAYGYNYTDLYIDSFEVDGAGGGNLEVSLPDAGGGKHTCCATLTSGLPVGTPFTIKWTRDRARWCEQTVKLTTPIPVAPRYLEVHFYPDGHIEIAATVEASAPRLKLERFDRGQRKAHGNDNHDERLSRCRHGYV